MNALKRWFIDALPSERAALARRLSTTTENLRQIAFAYRSVGVSRLSADKAVIVEQYTAQTEREGLPRVSQESVCPGCMDCPYLKKCRSGV